VLEVLVQRWLLTFQPNTALTYRLQLERWFSFCRARGHEPLIVGAGVMRE